MEVAAIVRSACVRRVAVVALDSVVVPEHGALSPAGPRVLLAHNFYRTSLPSGENDVVRA